MKKIILSIILVFLIAFSTDRILGEFQIFSRNVPTTQKSDLSIKDNVVPQNDPLNITYTIEGDTFTLKDGKGTTTSTADSIITSSVIVFGTPIYGDIDGDGDQDAAIFLVQQSGGTGSFYYAVLALNTGTEYKSTNALFLGDRIEPQAIEIHEGKTIFNYMDRKIEESMATPPSVPKSVTVNFDPKTNTISTAP